MVFLAVFMMPFYYGSKARSVPEYLKLRFDERTRALNSVSFAGFTTLPLRVWQAPRVRAVEKLCIWISRE
jgi:SSS family solute:Na+ symporter